MASRAPVRRADIPGPKPLPILGPVGNLVHFSRDVIGNTGRLFREYGPMVGLVGGDINAYPRLARWVFALGPDFNREIASQHGTYHKPPSTKHLHPRGENLSERKMALQRWGAGLFNFNGEDHKRHRRLLQPA